MNERTKKICQHVANAVTHSEVGWPAVGEREGKGDKHRVEVCPNRNTRQTNATETERTKSRGMCAAAIPMHTHIECTYHISIERTSERPYKHNSKPISSTNIEPAIHTGVMHVRNGPQWSPSRLLVNCNTQSHSRTSFAGRSFARMHV